MLIRHGAKVELGDSDGMTPLQLAIFYRKKKAADIILEMGAEIVFPVGTPLSQGTALHAAVSGASSSETVLRYLLTKHPKLRATAVINSPDMNGWMTLHKAAYYGDHDGIEAPLEFGAGRTLRDISKGRTPGRTPLDRVSELLNQIHARGPGLDHNRVRRREAQAVKAFTANLDQIKHLLEHE